MSTGTEARLRVREGLFSNSAPAPEESRWPSQRVASRFMHLMLTPRCFTGLGRSWRRLLPTCKPVPPWCRATCARSISRTVRVDHLPVSGISHNVTEADRLACLARVRQHLRPAGRFAFNVFHPSLTYMAQHTGPLAGVWRWTGTYPLPSGGWVVQSEANSYDTVAQVVHSLHRYDEFGATGTLERTSMLRLHLAYLFPSDIRRLLEAAGFREIAIKGGFDGREFSEDGQELVVEALRDA